MPTGGGRPHLPVKAALHESLRLEPVLCDDIHPNGKSMWPSCHREEPVLPAARGPVAGPDCDHLPAAVPHAGSGDTCQLQWEPVSTRMPARSLVSVHALQVFIPAFAKINQHAMHAGVQVRALVNLETGGVPTSYLNSQQTERERRAVFDVRMLAPILLSSGMLIMWPADRSSVCMHACMPRTILAVITPCPVTIRALFVLDAWKCRPLKG